MRPLIARPIFAAATLVACVCAATPVEAADTLSKIREAQVITIAHSEVSMPFSCLDGNIANCSGLRDESVVTTAGTATVKPFSECGKVRFLALTLIEGRDRAESFSIVERGEAEAFTMDDVLLFGLRVNAQNPNGFVVVGDALSAEPYAVMLRKDDAPFNSVVDREGRLTHEGEIHRLYDKWFKNPVPPLGVNMPMGHLLRDDALRFSGDKAGIDT